MFPAINIFLVLAPLIFSLLLRPLVSAPAFGISTLLVPPSSSPSLQPSFDLQRILLVTAHPDDETLFFAPTLLSLLDAGRDVHVLCLSTGDAEGLGAERRTEFARAIEALGVQAENSWVLDVLELQDNMTLAWDVRAVAKTVRPYVIQHNISALLTFDPAGITSHPNHAAIPLGLAHLLTAPPSSSYSLSSLDFTPRLFNLVSVPVALRYTASMAAFMAKMDIHLGALLHKYVPQLYDFEEKLQNLSAASSKASDSEASALSPHAPPLPEHQDLQVFVSSASSYFRAVRAAWAHQTQMVWFRWLYLAWSRYMWVNEWVEVRPEGHEA